MTKLSSMFRIILCFILLSLWPKDMVAQVIEYDKALDEIMANHMSDYPEPTIKALDRLFVGTTIDELPAETQFFYHYYYGGCLAENNADAAIGHLTQARNVAYSCRNVGIRNMYALDAEKILADLYLAKGTYEYKVAAMFLYNDVITVGVSLLEYSYVGGLVIQALIELAKMGVEVWLDGDWVKKMWIQARDLAMEINDETYYSYYVLNVLKYYCDQEDFDTALSFMEDARNKDILMVDVASYCQYISDTKRLLRENEEVMATKGAGSLEYWSNMLGIATFSRVLCSEKKSIELLQAVEKGLIENRLTESYEYAQLLYLLSDATFNQPKIAEHYFAEQVKLLETMPQYFVYISDAEVFNSLAVCQMKQGNYSVAQKNYEKALSCLDRDNAYSDQVGYKITLAVISHNLGRNLYFLGRYQESINYFTKSIALQNETKEPVMQKTIVYMSEAMDYISLN